MSRGKSPNTGKYIPQWVVGDTTKHLLYDSVLEYRRSWRSHGWKLRVINPGRTWLLYTRHGGGERHRYLIFLDLENKT